MQRNSWVRQEWCWVSVVGELDIRHNYLLIILINDVDDDRVCNDKSVIISLVSFKMLSISLNKLVARRKQIKTITFNVNIYSGSFECLHAQFPSWCHRLSCSCVSQPARCDTLYIVCRDLH